MSYEQNKERLSSASRRDGYFSYVSTRDSEVQNTTQLSVDSQRARSCSPCLPTATPTPTARSQQCKTPPPSVSTPKAPTTCNGKTSASALNMSATTTATAKKPKTTTATAIISESTATAALNTTATKTRTKNQNQNKIQQAGQAIQTGLDRYIHVKRKLSPQNTAVGNKSKVNRVQIENKLPGRSNSN